MMLSFVISFVLSFDVIIFHGGVCYHFDYRMLSFLCYHLYCGKAKYIHVNDATVSRRVYSFIVGRGASPPSHNGIIYSAGSYSRYGTHRYDSNTRHLGT